MSSEGPTEPALLRSLGLPCRGFLVGESMGFGARQNPTLPPGLPWERHFPPQSQALTCEMGELCLSFGVVIEMGDISQPLEGAQ